MNKNSIIVDKPYIKLNIFGIKIKIRKNIKAICSDETVQDIILNFDDKKIQITKRMVNFFIKKKLVFALMIVFRIKK